MGPIKTSPLNPGVYDTKRNGCSIADLASPYRVDVANWSTVPTRLRQQKVAPELH